MAYLQSTDDTRQLDELKDKGDYEGLLTLAKEYYDGNGINEKYTYSSPTNNKGDGLLVEDKNFAVVYNGSVGGTYEVMLSRLDKKPLNIFFCEMIKLPRTIRQILNIFANFAIASY